MLDHTGRQGVADLPVQDGRLNGRVLLSMMREWVPADECCTVVFEHVLGQSFAGKGGHNTLSSRESLARVRGAVEAVCDIAGWAAQPISVQKWKRPMGLWGCDDKDAGRLKAIELFPAMAKALARKKDHNRADSLLLAHWARGYLQ